MTTRTKVLRRNQILAGLTVQIAMLLTLAVFRSDKLVSFTYDLPSNAYNDQLVSISENWHNTMDKLGLTVIVSEVENLIENMRGEVNE